MAGQLNQFFLQSVVIDGAEVPREMVTTSAYVEHMNMQSPALELHVRDVNNQLMNEKKMKEGSLLVAVMGDSDGGMSWSDEMTIVSCPYANDTVRIVAIPKALHQLHQKTVSPRFFVDQNPKDMLSALSGEKLKLVADPFNRMTTYHLVPGAKPSALIDKIARDHGARAWIARGTLSVRTLSALQKLKPVAKYETNNPSAENLFTKARHLTQDEAYLSKVRYRFSAYSETEGYIAIGKKEFPIKMISDANREVLMNLSLTIIPKLDVECEGNASLAVGQQITVLIQRYDTDSSLDESVESSMVIMGVTHYEDRRSYVCRMILGVVKGA
ncbi:TPA: hypothetical protein ACGFAK_005040 [Serratia marcescens]|jgi:hypothetical protein|uniref:hypothetical protein n=1 Tax=Serratia TaxID=613 RepID=UPI0010202531|nr:MULTISPECIES: hypothetical protein [Serratia]MBP1133556.1 hypothetical protein [Serratia sp. PL17]RYM67325.1 hypothetical protein BSQ99_24455 [Serratia liquefaciens]HBL7241996.1 hypothetical protein [Serratia liquefaciens]HDS5480609.1 hypothetical protein [Serratia liquefaciens]